jgi:hypothetical protein
VEQSLVEHVLSGDWLDLTLSRGEVLNEAAMRSWGESRSISAAVIRDILRGRLVPDPDPRGVRLRGARIAGRLDLENLTTYVNLELSDCFLDEGLLAQDARMASVGLIRCQLAHPTDPPLDAARLTCIALDLTGARITGHAMAGGVNLRGAHIDDSLDCDGASLSNDSGPALSAEGLQVGQSINLRRKFTATRSGVRGVSQAGASPGAVRLTGARIGGSLDCTGASMSNDSGPALSADSLQVGQDIFLRSGFTAVGATGAGAIRLRGAKIGGSLQCDGQVSLRNETGPALVGERLQVGQAIILRDGFSATAYGLYGTVRLTGARIDGSIDCRGAVMSNEAGPALRAEGLQVGQDMRLSNGFNANGVGPHAVRLTGARIGGSLDCRAAWLTNNSGPALTADGLQVGQDMRLSNGFDATGAGDEGTVRLTGADIGGSLDCRGARLRNGSGSALTADSLHVTKNMLLSDGLEATGAGDEGTVRLTGADIGGSLDCRGARLTNKSGPALTADSLQVGQSVSLTRGFTATCAGTLGAVNLAVARIGGNLDCDGANLRNDRGSALAAYAMQVGQSVYFSRGFAAIGGGNDVTLDLTGARVGETLYFDPAQVEHTSDPHQRLAVDGLTYGAVTWISARDWLKLLRHATPRYAAQPYQQLATQYQAAGNAPTARMILIAQRDDQLARTSPGLRERLLGKIAKVTLGYGYQPWRALLWLSAVVALSCVLAVVLGAHGALEQTSKTAAPGRPCTLIQQVSVGMDLNLPFGTSLAREDCNLATNQGATAAWLTGTGVVLRALAWVFAALFAAGFAGAVRKA